MKNSYTIIKMGMLMPSWNVLSENEITNGTYFNEQIENKINVTTNIDKNNKINIGGTDYTSADVYIGFETPDEFMYHLVVGNIGTFTIKNAEEFDIKRGSSFIRDIKRDFEKIDNRCVIVNADMKLLRSEDFTISFVLSGDDINIRKKNVYYKFNWGTEEDFMIEVFNHDTKGSRYSMRASVTENNFITRHIESVIPFDIILRITGLKNIWDDDIVFDTVLRYKNLKLSKKTIRTNPFYQELIVPVVEGLKLLGYSVRRSKKVETSEKENEKEVK